MAVSNDLSVNAFAEPQNLLDPKPNTLASAGTIAPTHKVTFITGTVAVVTITPPQDGAHVLYLIWTNASPTATTTAGNIQRATQPVQNVPVLAVYDPSTAKYWMGPVSAVT